MLEKLINAQWWRDGEPCELLISDGRVVERARTIASPGAIERDLGGKTLFPAFVDSHCHILPTGLDLLKLHLGACATHDDVLDLLRAKHAELPEGAWLMAVHYDQTRFPGGIHMHRSQLDAISSTRPILLRHSNGHASVCNTVALTAAGVDRDTPDPKGGTYVRDADGPTGVLLEHAHEHVTNTAPLPTLDEMVDAILRAGEKMHGLGISCASDMMTGRYDLRQELQAYRLASERGCRIRTRLYLQWSTVFGMRAVPKSEIEDLTATMDPLRCRVAGIKIFADGAIASATAAIYGHFETQPERAGEATSGQLIYQPDRLKMMVQTAHDAGHPVSIHSIGDYATDLVMDAFASVDEPSRHRIEHAMILSDTQIDRMASLGIHCTMQPEFLKRFGHAYGRQLGPTRMARLKRARSVKDAGIPLSFSSDRPIVPGDPLDGVATAIKRPEGFDTSEEVTFQEAIDAYTAMGSVANGEPGLMGTLEPGSLADYRVG